MVGQDQRQFHPALPGAGADLHPARGEGDHRIGETLCPGGGEGGGRSDDDGTGEVGLLPFDRGAKVAEVENWQPEQLRRLEYAVATNRQVYEANLDGQPIPDLVKALIERFEPPAPPAQPKQDPWEPPF